MRLGITYIQHPVGLWDAEPFATAERKLGPDIEGVYWRVVEAIRKGNGIDSLEHILTLYDHIPRKNVREKYQKLVKEILKAEHNLFLVTLQDMVVVVNHAKLIVEQNRRALEEGPSLFNPDEINSIND